LILGKSYTTSQNNLEQLQLERGKEREGYRILGIVLDFDKNKITGPQSF